MKNLTFAPAKRKDAGALLKIYSPYVAKTAVSFEYAPPTQEEFADRIEKISVRYPFITASIDGEIIGYAYGDIFHAREAYNHCAELSIYVDKKHRRSGVGKALYKELEKRLAEKGIKNLYACIAYPPKEDEYLTLDSVRFHEKMGYRQVGYFSKCGYKFGRYYDMVYMEKLI